MTDTPAPYLVAFYDPRIVVAVPESIAWEAATVNSCHVDPEFIHLSLVRDKDGIKGSVHGGYRNYETAAAKCHDVLQAYGIKFGRTQAELVEITDQRLVLKVSRKTLRPVLKKKTKAFVKSEIIPNIPPVETTPVKISLREAIEAVNQHQAIIGPSLILEILPNGRLRALVEYGG